MLRNESVRLSRQASRDSSDNITYRFLKTQPDNSHAFLEKLLKTQAFQRFVEDRTFPSKDNAHVQFFDESIVAKVCRALLFSAQA